MENLIILGFAIGIILDVVLAFFNKEKDASIKISNYSFRIHHCILGIIAFILAIFYSPYFFISFGIGIILSHTIRTKEFKIVEIKRIKNGK